MLRRSRRRRFTLWLFFVALGCVLFGSRASHAHQVGVSRGDYRLAGDSLSVELVFAGNEVMDLVPELDANHDDSLSQAEVDAGRKTLERAIVPALEVKSDGPCPGTLTSADIVAEDGLRTRSVYRCAGQGPVDVRVALVERLASGHRQVALVTSGMTQSEVVLHRGNSTFSIPRMGTPVAKQSSFLSMVWTGMEHIFEGYDHLMFLFALVLVGGKLRSLLWVITAFTLGHSVTLAIAALGVYVPSPRVIEPLIALSIAFVGVENFFISDYEKRWRVTLPFGLVHGFGFAGALRELALDQRTTVKAVFAFNLGVELGQILTLLPVVPLVLYLRKFDWFRGRGVQVTSGLVALVGVVLVVLRLIG